MLYTQPVEMFMSQKLKLFDEQNNITLSQQAETIHADTMHTRWWRHGTSVPIQSLPSSYDLSSLILPTPGQ